MPALRAVATVVLVLSLSGSVAACGASGDRQQPRALDTDSPADRACQQQWAELGRPLGDEAAQGVLVRQAFQTRWDAIQAGIGYYAATARANQCGDLLTAQRQAIDDLEAVVAKALRYDVAQRVNDASAARRAWRAKHPKAQEPKPVRAAYRTLKTEAIPAGRALTPAFTELASADPADHPAVRRGLSDLALLAKTSDAYVACRQALATVGSKHRQDVNRR